MNHFDYYKNFDTKDSNSKVSAAYQLLNQTESKKLLYKFFKFEKLHLKCSKDSIAPNCIKYHGYT